jgi:hypothetical protein
MKFSNQKIASVHFRGNRVDNPVHVVKKPGKTTSRHQVRERNVASERRANISEIEDCFLICFKINRKVKLERVSSLLNKRNGL